jgi:hypothetical protein
MNALDLARLKYDVTMILAEAEEKAGHIKGLIESRKQADDAFAEIVRIARDTKEQS